MEMKNEDDSHSGAVWVDGCDRNCQGQSRNFDDNDVIPVGDGTETSEYFKQG